MITEVVPRVVVDSSVIVDLLIDPGAQGRAIADRLRGCMLAAPDLLPYEVTDVLRRLRNAGKLSNAEAGMAMSAFQTLSIDLWPHEAVAERVWALGRTLSGYDASFVALAELLGTPLITADGKLSRASGPTARIDLIQRGLIQRGG